MTSCNNNQSSEIPSESGNSEYIEGNPDTGGEGEGSNNEGAVEGIAEGINEGEFKYTSAGVYNTRKLEYSPATNTTDTTESEEDGETEDTTRELVEPDVYRVIGNHLFVLNQYRGLTIVDMDSKSVVSNVPIYGYPRDLYISNDRAYILIGYTIKHTIEEGIVKKTTGSQLYIVDIEDLETPELVSSLPLPGDFIDSRLLGNILYAVTSDYQYYYVDDTNSGDGDGTVSSDDSWTVNSGSKCWISSVDITQIDNPQIKDRKEFPGYGTVIQASTSAIYVCASIWEENKTQITYIDITDPNGTIADSLHGSVPGYVADRFKLDEWNGMLRVVSNTWWPDRQTYLTIFDVSNLHILDVSNLQQISQITIDASGETLYATRFAGHLAYLVTYLTKDPLFVIDLSDPTKPEVKGKLEVPGWSMYIEPIGNDQLIALGVDDTQGQQRVKVSWFDVSDPSNPTEKSVVSIGEGWTWSSAFSDVKSFAVFGNLIIVPFSGWNGNEYKEQLQFIRLDTDSQKLTPLGSVDMKGQVSRTIKYNEYYYAITSEYLHEIQCEGTNPPTLTDNIIPLTEYVADVIETGLNEEIIEVINHGEDKNIEIRLVSADTVNSIPINTTGQYMEGIKINENSFAFVINEWNYEPTYESYYRLVFINIDENSNLSIQQDIKVSIAPYYYYWWNWCRGCEYTTTVDVGNFTDAVPATGTVARSSQKILYPYYYRGWYPSTDIQPVMVCDGYIILRGWGSQYDIILGKDTPNEGFALIPVSNPKDFKLVGLGYNVASLSSIGNKLLLTIQKYLDNGNYNYPLVAYFLCEIDLDTLIEPNFTNVPGVLLASNSGGNILFLKDWQYDTSQENYNYELWIRSINWQVGHEISVIDSVKMSYPWSNVYIQPPYLFTLSSNNNLTLTKMDISEEGKFINQSETKIGEVWGDIVGIGTNHLYLDIDGASILTASIGYNTVPILENIFPIPAYPQKVRTGNKGIYIIFGYSGYSIIPF